MWCEITSLLLIWYDHPLITAFLGILVYILYDYSPFGSPIGQPEHGSKKSKGNNAPDPKVVIIGAGAGGLAAAACLKKEGIPFIIFEKSNEIGTPWKNRYDRLHLHTTRDHSALPFLPFPSHLPIYPSKDDVVNYLNGYATSLGLRPHIHFGHTVKKAELSSEGKIPGKFHIVVEDEEGRSHDKYVDNIIVAVGENGSPKVPHFPDQNKFQGKILHTSVYKNGSEFTNKKVMVLGFGNSGAEIAIDLWEHDAKPTILVRRPVTIVPRKLACVSSILDLWLGRILRLLPLDGQDATILKANKVLFGDLKEYGLRVPNNEPPMTTLVKKHKVFVLDVGTVDLIRKREVKVVENTIDRFTETGVIYSDGKAESFDAVIFATGFDHRVTYEAFLDKKITDIVHNEYGVIDSGKESPQSSLYFIGYNDRTGRFREIHLEARRIAKLIKRSVSN